MSDLIYTSNGFFTRFIANTKEGEEAYNEIYRVTGDGAVRNDHLKQTLNQLRKAGYKVTKAKTDNINISDILSEFDELFK